MLLIFLQKGDAGLTPRHSADNNDIAQWAPNPFLDYNPSSNPSADVAELSLVDGGEDLQNIPFNPLVQPQRAVDVIFAVDSSADTTFNWPNGTALRASYERSLAPIANGTLFPAIPDAETFISLGLNSGPAFFGCNTSNFTLTGGAVAPPLVVYLPNAPYSAFSNVSTFEPTTELATRDAIVKNGYDAATLGNGTLDADWPACVACAALSRSLERTGTAVPSGCTACFERYCWNGTLASGGSYEPSPKIGGDGSAASSAGARAVDALGMGFRAQGVGLAVAVMIAGLM